MRRVTITECRKRLSELVSEVSAGERVLVSRAGEDAAALVPVPDFRRLERDDMSAARGSNWLFPMGGLD